MKPSSLLPLLSFITLSLPAVAADSATPGLPKLNDPALRIEALCTTPEIEAPATVAAAPDGSFYVGCDPRDTRLNTKEPVCTVIRYSSMGTEKKRTVFAEKLYSPAGSLWHDGWLYVIHDPLMSRFKDTDGDGVADVREDLITNLGMMPGEGINDHVVSGLTLGMDGFFYISVGDRGIHKARSTREVQAAEKTGKAAPELSMEGGGVIRCRPDGTQMEIFSTGTRNHLSVLLDAEDNVFTRDNTDDGNGWWSRVTHHVEGGYYGYPYDYQSAPNNGVTAPSDQTKATARGGKGGFTPGGSKATAGQQAMDSAEVSAPIAARPFLPAMADFGGGSPTGGVCYLSDGLPEQYRGKLFFSEWGKSGLFVTEVVRDGATFKLVKDTPLVQTDGKVDFRPLEVSIANDGSLLIADWGWGGWKADRKAGTIWRLSWPEAKPAARLLDESKATAEELTAALGHVDRGQRLRAQWELAKRNEDTMPVATSSAATTLQRLHALWALEDRFKSHIHAAKAGLPGAGASNPPFDQIVRGAHTRKEGVLLVQAVRALGQSGRFQAAELMDAADLELRRHAVTALGRSVEPDAELASTLVRAFADEDPWIRSAAAAAFRRPEITDLVAHQLSGAKVPVGVWPAFATNPTVASVNLMAKLAGDSAKTPPEKQTRLLALTTLGSMAFKPKPYDGHWWGTQPAKNPRPLPNVPWEGTTPSLQALTTALSDGSPDVRTTAAQAFRQFVLADPADVAASPGPKETALAALRSRLQAESEPQVRQALIEALATQRDARAMPVFTTIALDEKAEPAFRKSVIAAITAIGGNDATKTIAQLAGAALPKPVFFALLDAVSKLKVTDAAPGLIARLHEGDLELREKTIRALASLGAKSGATSAFVELLKDSEERIRIEALSGLEKLRDKAALPSLLTRAGSAGSGGKPLGDQERRTLIGTISSLADVTAIPVLIEALKEKPDSRRDALKALKAFREEAWPLIEQRLASGEIRAELEPEIRRAFDTGAIVKWKIIGPFENVWAAVHPPEADAIASQGVVDLSRKYKGSDGKETGWREVSGGGEHSQVDLGSAFQASGMDAAYAYAEIEAAEAAAAELLCGGDDQIAIWLNGQKILDVPEGRNFRPDADKVPVQLAAGTNRLLVKVGNKSGSWEFAVRMPGLQGTRFVKSTQPAAEAKQRAYALATKPDGTWQHGGDAAKGSKLFHDPSASMGAICATCHIASGKGGQIGPNLTSIGTNYKRADLITSLHEPAKTIALGYEQVAIETKGGDTIAGSLRAETAEVLTVVTVDGQSHAIKKSDVKTNTHLAASLMPPGLTTSMRPEEFVDLLAYLESLRGQ